jgi:hypothetical protein
MTQILYVIQSCTYLNNVRRIRTSVKVNKNGKGPGEDNINLEFYKYALEKFKLRSLQFLNNIYTEDCIPNEWRNTIVIPIFKKDIRRDPKKYIGINILNTCYKIYSKILNMKLQSYSEEFMTETHDRLRKRRSCTFCLKLLIEK